MLPFENHSTNLFTVVVQKLFEPVLGIIIILSTFEKKRLVFEEISNSLWG